MTDAISASATHTNVLTTPEPTMDTLTHTAIREHLSRTQANLNLAGYTPIELSGPFLAEALAHLEAALDTLNTYKSAQAQAQAPTEQQLTLGIDHATGPDQTAVWTPEKVLHIAANAFEKTDDPIQVLIGLHTLFLETNPHAYFELAYTRHTGWMAWICDKPAKGTIGDPDFGKNRTVLATGLGDTAEEACDAAIDQLCELRPEFSPDEAADALEASAALSGIQVTELPY